MRKIITGACAYILIAFLTFGWTYNHTELCYHGPHPETQQVGDWCYSEQWRVNQAGMVGTLWIVVLPFAVGAVVLGSGWHWITQGAIAITRWP